MNFISVGFWLFASERFTTPALNTIERKKNYFKFMLSYMNIKLPKVTKAKFQLLAFVTFQIFHKNWKSQCSKFKELWKTFGHCRNWCTQINILSLITFLSDFAKVTLLLIKSSKCQECSLTIAPRVPWIWRKMIKMTDLSERPV